jgi:hypothetical protein
VYCGVVGLLLKGNDVDLYSFQMEGARHRCGWRRRGNEAVKLLLDKGANIEIKDEDGCKLLVRVIDNRFKVIIKN